MKSYSFSHLADHVLLREFVASVSDTRTSTAAMLAYLAEVDERKLYLPAAYPSMYVYCVKELHMSEDTAFKRIRVARTARQFPAIFLSLADGRLNLSAVLLLAPKLKPDTAPELLAAAAHKTHTEIELLLAQRFPRPDLPTLVQAMAAPVASNQQATWPVGESALQLAPGPVVPSVESDGPLRMEPLASRPKVAPLAPDRFAIQFTADRETYEDLLYAQALLGHTLPSGDVAQVFKRALRELVEKLEQQKFAKSSRSRPRRSSANDRYVPAEVRRTVWRRDGGQCTFESEGGRRCEERTRLEFDHEDTVARGGVTTSKNLRLRCRAHNQYAAECTFGAGFMRGKREQARCRAAQTKARALAQMQAK